MSTINSGARRLSPLADTAAITAGSMLLGVARKAIDLVASAIVHRAERRLMHELYALDDRMLDHIGIDRGQLGVGPYRHEATQRALLAPCMN